MSSRRLRFVTPLVLALIASTGLVAQSAQQNAQDVDRLITALEIQPGSTVGEMGAGDGELTLAIAKAVGETGHVFSNEFNTERLSTIRAAVTKVGLKNVTVVEGHAARTNFSDRCCSAIFMRNVYHHFSDPPAMNASLFASLEPGGRLAVLDFGPPPGAESPSPAGRSRDGHHGVTPPTVEKELRAAGFEILSVSELGFRAFMVVARRPLPPCDGEPSGRLIP